jgi:hypothetical protein
LLVIVLLLIYKVYNADCQLCLQNELCRIKLDLPFLDKLVHEYCMYRGIVEGCPSTPGMSMLVVEVINTVYALCAFWIIEFESL